MRSFVIEERVDDLDERLGPLYLLVEDPKAALIQNSVFGRLEDDVVARVALFEFAFDLAGEVVVTVLSFPNSRAEDGKGLRAPHRRLPKSGHAQSDIRERA